MSKKFLPALLTVLAFGSGMAWAETAVPASEPSRAASADRALTVGVRYVPPPFVGGEKVRTPENVETLLVEQFVSDRQEKARLVELDASSQTVASGAVDFAVVDLPVSQTALPEGVLHVATGQVTRPMAIMRTDTDIKSWQQLKGRTVCLSKDGRYVGQMSRQYGAIEQVYRAPADSLLAMRTGACDAAVHDDTLLKALLKFPEWKKFSANLQSKEALQQYFVVPADNTPLHAQLQKVVQGWKSKGYLKELVARMARDIAFEVYLDQTVPDCH